MNISSSIPASTTTSSSPTSSSPGWAFPSPTSTSASDRAATGAQTGAMLTALDPIFDRERPDWVLVYGDTNSTIAAALAAVKLHVPVAHLEAGLRSFNRRMPEEHNRVLTDHAADLLLAPTEVAMQHLADENLGSPAPCSSGTSWWTSAFGCGMPSSPIRSRSKRWSESVDDHQPYVVGTLHRPDNTDRTGTPRGTGGGPRRTSRPGPVGRPSTAGRQGPAARHRPRSGLDPALPSVRVRRDGGGDPGIRRGDHRFGRVCRRRRTCCAGRARRFGRRPSGSRRWRTAGTFWCRNPRQLRPDELAELVTRAPSAAAQRMPFGDGRAARLVVDVLAARFRA